MSLTVQPLEDGPDDGFQEIVEELTVRVMVSGTTFMATYVIEGGTVLLSSADFGDASAALEDLAPEEVAARLLREMATAAMACSSVRYMRDDEVNVPDP